MLVLKRLFAIVGDAFRAKPNIRDQLSDHLLKDIGLYEEEETLVSGKTYSLTVEAREENKPEEKHPKVENNASDPESDPLRLIAIRAGPKLH